MTDFIVKHIALTDDGKHKIVRYLYKGKKRTRLTSLDFKLTTIPLDTWSVNMIDTTTMDVLSWELREAIKLFKHNIINYNGDI